MKKSKSIFAIIIISGFTFISCNQQPSENTSLSNGEDSDGEVKKTTPPKEETLCFMSKNAEGDQYSMQLTLKGDSITGTSDETLAWLGEKAILTGIRNGDTLFINTTFSDGPGGDLITQEDIYLLQSDKLYQKSGEIGKLTNGNMGLKDPAKAKFSFPFDKINCK